MSGVGIGSVVACSEILLIVYLRQKVGKLTSIGDITSPFGNKFAKGSDFLDDCIHKLLSEKALYENDQYYSINAFYYDKINSLLDNSNIIIK